MTVGIISAGLGNIASIQRMLQRSGADWTLVSSPGDLANCEALILPGVGHFDEGIRALRKAGLIDVLSKLAFSGNIPILGICLGMQLLCRSSEEGNEPGLGFVDADVKKFQFLAHEKLKVPHMGWNLVYPASANQLLPCNEVEQRFYFVHSYHVVPDDQSIVIGIANYGGDFCAAFQRNNIFGVQFHPEKSHRFGMALLKRFVEYQSC